MLKSLTKRKMFFVSILTVVAVAFSVIGITTLNKNQFSANAADNVVASEWNVSTDETSFDSKNCVTTINNSSIVANKVNILDLPNKTAIFSIRILKSGAWSGFSLLNGLTSGEANWDQIIWPGTMNEIDQLPHLIIQDGSAQVYGNTTETIFGAAAMGVKNMPQNTFNYFTSIEVHIGTGEGTDISYIKIAGEQLNLEDNSSALKFAKISDFTKGCFIGFHFNLQEIGRKEINLSNYSAPIISSISEEFKGIIDLTKETPVANDLQFKVSNIIDPTSAVLKLDDNIVEAKYFTVATENNILTYTIKANLWKEQKMTKKSLLTVDSTNGKAVIVLNIQANVAPKWENDLQAEKILETIGDVVYLINSEQELTASNLIINSGVYMSNVDRENALQITTDYTIESMGNNVYKITILKAYFEGKFDVYNGRFFLFNMGDNSLNAKIYIKSKNPGWVTRRVDIKEGTTLDVNDYYTSGTFTKFGVEDLSTRTYYNQALNVASPIFIEVQDFDSTTEWGLLQISDSLINMDYFSNDTKEESKLQALFFGGRTDIQKFYGFVESASTNASYEKCKMKNTVIEIFFGVTQADGYIKINGVDCGKPSAIQTDFKDSKAYVGWFINNQIGEHQFKVNSHVNAISVAGPLEENSYSMDLAEVKDFEITLQNYSNDFSISNDKGYALEKEKDYTFDSATGKLTFKASYFSSLAFAKKATISIWDNVKKTGTQFNMKYTSSKMLDSSVAFAVKNHICDTEIKLPSTVTKIDSIILANEDVLSIENYSFANGTLTIKKEAIANEIGKIEFLVFDGASIAPTYIIVNEYKDNGVKISGEGTINSGNDAYIFGGNMTYEFMKSFNFNEGAIIKIDFKNIPGYYKGGLNYTGVGYVTFKFYDPYSKNTLIYTLYANYASDEVTATDTALYEEYQMIDFQGKVIILKQQRAVKIADSKNPNALGAHLLKFEAVNGGLKITVDNSRATTISNLAGFNLSASVLNISTPANEVDKTMNLGIKLYGINDTPTYSAVTTEKEKPIDPPKDPVVEPDKKNGCKKTKTNSTGLVTSSLLGLGMILFFKKRKI